MCKTLFSRYKQGQIWLANYPDESKRHFVIIVSNNIRNEITNDLLVVPITHNPFIPEESVEIDLFGKDDISFIRAFGLCQLSKSSLIKYIGFIDNGVFDKIVETILDMVILREETSRYEKSDSTKIEDHIDCLDNSNPVPEENNIDTAGIFRIRTDKMSDDQIRIAISEYQKYSDENKLTTLAKREGFVKPQRLYGKMFSIRTAAKKRGIISESDSKEGAVNE